ncbi:hypothetical protein [Deinococcus sp. QL22]|uniref:hypothetical protein n=1 Tax=Deinococcus sp. QL22 TaxID=2939437 RepID=UPI0020175DA8|nr:hypothetical protein [Deinococcus sp. QL22]UQN10714.1 hypothetical protein M1R55_30550 [Deinococcus sp. QL22]
MSADLENLSDLALLNLKWIVKVWRRGDRNGPAFELDTSLSEEYDAHPVVLCLRELEVRGYITIAENEFSRLGWTLGADLTAAGIALAEDEDFDDHVPPEIYPWP